MVALQTESEARAAILLDIRDIVGAARKKHGKTYEGFSDVVNSYYGCDLSSRMSVYRLEKHGLDGGDKRLLGLLSPFTDYTPQELYAIADGKLITRLIKRQSNSKMQGHPSVGSYMPAQSTISLLIEEFLENDGISRSEFAELAGLTMKRLNQIVDEGAEPTDLDYQAIARGFAAMRRPQWKWEMLKSLFALVPDDGLESD